MLDATLNARLGNVFLGIILPSPPCAFEYKASQIPLGSDDILQYGFPFFDSLASQLLPPATHQICLLS